jgi:chromate transport protein ChrA
MKVQLRGVWCRYNVEQQPCIVRGSLISCTEFLFHPQHPQMAPVPEKEPSVSGPTLVVFPTDTSSPRERTEAVDEESLRPIANQQSPTSTPPNQDEHGYHDNSNVPKMAYPKLFWFFLYNFGLFAWGGPVAQIALIKERLVVQDKWITLPRFQRVFSVYQILPGPEAAELCMFFGCLSAGRIGGLVAGLAFMLPGFLLMILASYLYTLAGFENVYFNASFKALQPIVAAMVCLHTVSLAEAQTELHHRFSAPLIKSPSIP